MFRRKLKTAPCAGQSDIDLLKRTHAEAVKAAMLAAENKNKLDDLHNLMLETLFDEGRKKS